MELSSPHCLPFPVEESTESEPSSGNRHYPVAAAIQRAGRPETEVPDKPVLAPRAVPRNKNVVTPWEGNHLKQGGFDYYPVIPCSWLPSKLGSGQPLPPKRHKGWSNLSSPREG